MSNGGSPPHARGKVRLPLIPPLFAGITPAYAGKRSCPCSGSCCIGDHPRIRGEKLPGKPWGPCGGGSPPHTRGKELPHLQRVFVAGITPAYAGKSFMGRRVEQRSKDHPRIRGEKLADGRVEYEVRGSPPHTRGKGKAVVLTGWRGGITPAYAGKSGGRGRGRERRQDHPRIRGEKYGSMSSFLDNPGSPPHTRGKATIGGPHGAHRGITPAYAGKRQGYHPSKR